MYINNNTDIKMNKDDYFEQFTIDYDGSRRKLDGVRDYLLNKLRNSFCHFRFKPVKDNDGNILENMIYLYDKFDGTSDTNFNMIVELKDLVAVAKELEDILEANKQQGKVL